MKTWILAIAMMMGVTMSAQNDGRKTDRPNHDKRRMEQKAHLTPEQRTELRAKQLTLALDLNDKQQKDVQKLIQGREVKKQELIEKHKVDREAGKKLTDDERFAMRSQMLDDRIALKREMKKILNTDRYAKFEKMGDQAHHKGFNGKHKVRNIRRK